MSKLGPGLVVAVLALSPLTASAESPPSEVTYSVTLEGCQRSPVVSTAARGSALVRMSLFSDVMTYSVAFADLGSAEVSAHIHGPAARGADGPIVFTLPLGTSKDGTFNLTPQQQGELQSGRWYIDIHSVDWPDGELRGQIDNVGSACPPPVDAAVPGPDAGENPGLDAGEGEGNPGGGCGGCATDGSAGPGLAVFAAAALLIRRRRAARAR